MIFRMPQLFLTFETHQGRHKDPGYRLPAPAGVLSPPWALHFLPCLFFDIKPGGSLLRAHRGKDIFS